MARRLRDRGFVVREDACAPPVITVASVDLLRSDGVSAATLMEMFVPVLNARGARED